MRSAQVNPLPTLPDLKIGVPPHWRRRAVVIGAIGALTVGVVTLFSVLSGRSSSQAIEELEQFRAAIAAQCEAPTFAHPSSRLERDLYLHSTRLQTIVAEQAAALDSGAPCSAVLSTLRRADYPMPPASAMRPSPTVRLKATP